MPVVRNPQFYFKEGFCWTDVNSTFLKARLKGKGVFDVISMTLFTKTELPDSFFVSIINSNLISFYVDNFINNTSHFQINDARQTPIVIPNNIQLNIIKSLFDKLYTLKQLYFQGKINEKNMNEQIKELEKSLNNLIEDLYSI